MLNQVFTFCSWDESEIALLENSSVWEVSVLSSHSSLTSLI